MWVNACSENAAGEEAAEEFIDRSLSLGEKRASARAIQRHERMTLVVGVRDRRWRAPDVASSASAAVTCLDAAPGSSVHDTW
jgi:hypothetical protein